MNIKELFSEAVNAVADNNALTCIGTVSEINGNFCTVEREDLPPLLDVRLNAVNSDITDYFVVVPKLKSKVLCVVIENERTETAIIKYSEIDRIEIKIKDAIIELKNGKFTLKNKSVDLKSILKDALNQLQVAKILTPAGAGSFSPDDIAKFAEFSLKFDQLFN